jgi:hypothetical protein
MNIDDLTEKIRMIDLKCELEKLQARKEYCFANNKVNIGDVFVDHIGGILVQKISAYCSRDYPCCTYSGIELKKDLTPKKNMSVREAFQSNQVAHYPRTP